MDPKIEGLELHLETSIEELEPKIAPSDTVFPFMKVFNPDGGGGHGGGGHGGGHGNGGHGGGHGKIK